jgi:hypothetical protein
MNKPPVAVNRQGNPQGHCSGMSGGFRADVAPKRR